MFASTIAPLMAIKFSAVSAWIIFISTVWGHWETSAALGFGPGGLNGESTVHNYSLAAGFDKAIGTNLLTDFRFGYFKYNPRTAYSDANTNPMTGFGIPGLNLGTSETGGLSSFFPERWK